MIIFLAGLRQIPTDMYEAASLDGASKWRQFWKITLPLLTPVIFFNAVVQTIEAFKAFTPGLHHLGRHRRADQLDAVLHALPLPGGVRLLPHGLRLGARLDPRRDHRRLHRASPSSARAIGCTTMTDATLPAAGRRPGQPPRRRRRIVSLIVHVAADRRVDRDALSAAVDALGVGAAGGRDLHLALDLALARSSLDAYRPRLVRRCR